MTKFGDEWEKDKLNRFEDASFLSEYLIGKYGLKDSDINNGSFVLNVNGEWGFGKTYFLRNWADDLVGRKHPVVYFDAWENDFSKEPLLALISTINEQLTPFLKTPKAKAGLKKWLNTGKKLLAPSAPLLMSILAKKAFEMSSEEFSEYLSDEDDSSSSEDSLIESTESDSKEIESTIGTVVSKAASKMLEAHSSTRQTIKEFKDNLGELTKHIDSLKGKNAPIFIFIDELDRCRPNYAIEVLENIKHLFGVPGVFFVIATASEQLTHSIKAVYGQDFDGQNYLKRFFDQTYTLFDPDRYSYSKYLFKLYGLEKRENLYSPLNENQCKTANPLIESFAWLTSMFKCSLRDMKQYCVVIDSISLTFNKERIHILFLIFLIILKDKDILKFKDFQKGIDPKIKDMEISRLEFGRTFSTRTFGHGVRQINFNDLISYYFNFSNYTLPKLNNIDHPDTYFSEAIRKVLLENMPYNWDSNDEPNHFLLKYPELIEQAGRLN